MARAGITYHDVVKAAEALKTLGQEPTVDRVRERLGTGSKSTIAPLLKRWRSNHSEVSDTSGLPGDVVEAVKSLYERIQQAAEHRIDQALQEFNTAKDTLKKELTDARNTVSQLTARQNDLEKQIVHIADEKAQQGKALEDTRINLVTAELRRDEAISRAADQKESIIELRQENRDIREHFEHYQQRTAEDRQQERDQFRTVNQHMQDQTQELRERLAQAEGSASQLLDINDQLRGSVAELERVNAELRSEIDRKAEDNGSLKHTLDEALMLNNKHQDEKDQLAERLTTLIIQKAAMDKDVVMLRQGLEIAKAELHTAQEKVALLDDENKLILQEKALILGQFKQLQNSLNQKE